MSAAPTIAEANCVICGAKCRTTRRVHTHFGPFISVADCPSCGHVFQCPLFDKSYADEFFAAAYAEGHENTYFDPQLKLKHARAIYDDFRAKCPSAGRILEIGGGLGAFSRVLADNGHDVVSTEMSETGVRRAKELFGLNMHLGPVDTLPPSAPFDAVIMWDVIEHLPAPDAVLNTAAERLKPGGWFALTTGNYESASRFSGGDTWWCWAPDHYHYFSPATLKRLVERLGFTDFKFDRVIRVTVPTDGNTTAPPPSPLRFLNPLHVARSINAHARNQIAKWRWPDHWDIGVMLATMKKAPAGATH